MLGRTEAYNIKISDENGENEVYHGKKDMESVKARGQKRSDTMWGNSVDIVKKGKSMKPVAFSDANGNSLEGFISSPSKPTITEIESSKQAIMKPSMSDQDLGDRLNDLRDKMMELQRVTSSILQKNDSLSVKIEHIERILQENDITKNKDYNQLKEKCCVLTKYVEELVEMNDNLSNEIDDEKKKNNNLKSSLNELDLLYTCLKENQAE